MSFSPTVIQTSRVATVEDCIPYLTLPRPPRHTTSHSVHHLEAVLSKSAIKLLANPAFSVSTQAYVRSDVEKGIQTITKPVLHPASNDVTADLSSYNTPPRPLFHWRTQLLCTAKPLIFLSLLTVQWSVSMTSAHVKQ